MSDEMWDREYDKAYDLKQEIIEYCKNNNLETPIFEECERSRDLEKRLKNLQASLQTRGG